MNLQTLIFIGRSGCGKGTQAELLGKYIQENDKEGRDIFYLVTGDQFRKLIKKKNYTGNLALKIYDDASRQPDFLAVYLWSSVLIDEFSGDQHHIIDGTPRSLSEIEILDTAMKFYGREKPVFIYMNVTSQWAIERLYGRGRLDDAAFENLKIKQKWFDSDVIPAIKYAKKNPLYRFVEINGEQSIEEVHQEIIQKIFPKNKE